MNTSQNRPQAVILVAPSNGLPSSGAAGKETVSTAKEAYQKAVSLINSGEATDIQISFLSGTHVLEEELVFRGEEIAVDDYSIELSGDGEGAVLSSNYEIPASAFQKEGEVYTYTLPDSLKKDGCYPAFRDLYIDGRLARLSQSKEQYRFAVDTAKQAEQNGLSKEDRLFYVAKSAVSLVSCDADGNVASDLELWIQIDWQIHGLRVEHIDRVTHTGVFDENGEETIAVRVREKDWNSFLSAYYSFTVGRLYWFSNHESYVKEPGDFYYDRSIGKIYVKPYRSLAETKTIAFPRAQRLFHFRDMKHVTLKNLSFTGTTVNFISENGYVSSQAGDIRDSWHNPENNNSFERVGFLPYGAVYGRNMSDLLITDCRFFEIGGDAVNFRGAVEGARVVNSHFESIGGTAIRFADATFLVYHETNHYDDLAIQNNFLTNTGVNFHSNPAIVVGHGKNIDISYNTVLDSAYTAISVGWSWICREAFEDWINDEELFTNLRNVNISHNYIENFMTKMQDGGAIYVLGGNANDKLETYLNSMNHNYVVLSEGTGNGSDHWTVYYHDGGASHWEDYHNVLIIHPKSLITLHTYISYQTVKTQEVYRCLTRDMVLIGYRPDQLRIWCEWDGERIRPLPGKTEAEWHAYLPSWFDTAYPNWYQEWVVNENLPEDDFIGWYLARGARRISDEEKEIYRVRKNPETGTYTVTTPAIDERYNKMEDIYLHTTFAAAEKTNAASLARSVAETAGCASYHPTYGAWSAKK